MAEQISLTFAQAHVIDKKGQPKCSVVVPVNLPHSRDEYAPLELGTTMIFRGKCHLRGRFGHKASKCTKGKPPPTHTGTNRHNSKGI